MRIERALICISVGAALAISFAAAQPPATPPKEGVVPAEPGNPYRRAAQLPARIQDFAARQASLQPGQSTMLVWEVENPTGITLEPGPGRVQPRGSIQVTPAATTTYTLTVHGPNNQVLTKELTVTVAGTTPINTSSAATAKKEVARLANGKRDLSGVYDFSFGGGARGGARQAPAGPVLKPGAEKYRATRGPNDAGLTADCMPLAGPQAFSVPYQFQIVESAHSVAILHEYPGTFRIIPTDGGAHPVDPDPTWMGDSIGRWEGDTLVIDTIGFNDKTEISGFRHSEALHLVERFSRPDYTTLQYEAILEDPNVFAEPWKMTRTFTLRPDLTKIDEFVCEHNEDYSKYFEKK
ncbi:MAG TPA: hypothetical protein VGF16_21340 [Bryobacteraceae bacterium]